MPEGEKMCTSIPFMKEQKPGTLSGNRSGERSEPQALHLELIAQDDGPEPIPT
jgi:hypothetical protein